MIFLYINFTYASFQEVYISKIDNAYKNKINEKQLIKIIHEIENKFEKQLNINIFDYSTNGKPISLVYVPTSKLEKQISSQIKKIDTIFTHIQNYQPLIPKAKKEITFLKKNYKQNNKLAKQKVKEFNQYVKDVNNRKNISNEEFSKIKLYVNKEQKNIKVQLNRLKKEYKNMTDTIKKYNKEINTYNQLIGKYNTYIREYEAMNRGFKKVKGKTFILKQKKIKNSYKDGKAIKEKTEDITNSKIEIYGFDNLNELKVILAHELIHLVGIPHIDVKDALMNPIIQKSQLDNLSLTKADIDLFKKYF